MSEEYDFTATYSAEGLAEVFNVEALSNALDKAKTSTVSDLTKLTNHVSSFFDVFTSEQNTLTTYENIPVRRVVKGLTRSHPIASMNEFPVDTVQGMNGKYLDILATLRENHGQLAGIKSEMITPFTLWLGHVISNPTDLINNSAVDINQFKPIAYVQARKRLAKLYTRNDTGSTNLYTKVVNNHKDLLAVVSGVEELVLEVEESVSDSSKSVKAALDGLVVRIDELLELIATKPAEYPISKQAIGKIASYVSETAKACEIVSINSWTVIQLHSAVGNAIDKIDRVKL